MNYFERVANLLVLFLLFVFKTLYELYVNRKSLYHIFDKHMLTAPILLCIALYFLGEFVEWYKDNRCMIKYTEKIDKTIIDPVPRDTQVKVLLCTLFFICLIYVSAFYFVYNNSVKPIQCNVYVFDIHIEKIQGVDNTVLLTYGDGKYYFIGNYTKQLLPNHKYNILYTQKFGSHNHAYNDLILVKLEEIK